MGQSSPYHFNAFQKERLGWLGYGSSPALTTVTASGSYTINSMETNSAGSKALKIARGTTGYYFYVEARRGLGFDAGLTSNANVTNGVVVHLAMSADSNSSDLLDMTAGTSSWSDPALTAGQSFFDSTSGVTITVSSASSSGAVVAVSFGGPAPTPTPSPSPDADPGSELHARRAARLAVAGTVRRGQGGNAGELHRVRHEQGHQPVHQLHLHADGFRPGRLDRHALALFGVHRARGQPDPSP